jgi:transposase-like protein
MKKQLKEKARYLRKVVGKSIKSIAKELGVSSSSVSIWVKDIELTKTQKQKLKATMLNAGTKASAKMYREKRISCQKAGFSEIRENNLHLAGCMLYWGEGSKGKNSVVFTNSDPHMMNIFLRFLKECYGTNDENISVTCHSHVLSTKKLYEVEAYWLKVLNLPAECLRKGFVETRIPKRKSVKYPYGICTLTVNKTDLVQRIFGSIKGYAGIQDEEMWLN